MIKRIFLLTTTEFSKAIRQKLPYIAVLVIAAVLIASTLGSEALKRVGSVGASKTSAGTGGEGFVAAATATSYGLQISAVFLLVFGSLLFSSETSLGTLRTILIRPFRRWELFTAKVFLLVIFSVILVTMVIAVSWVFAWKLYGFHDVMEATKDWSSYRLVEKAQLVAWSRQAVLMCLPAVLAAGFFGLFISVIMENSGSAVAVAVLLFLPLNWVITNLTEKFSKYLFNSYMSRSLTILSERAQGFNEPLRQWKEMDVSMFIIVPAAYISFFFLASLVVFQRKDVLV